LLTAYCTSVLEAAQHCFAPLTIKLNSLKLPRCFQRISVDIGLSPFAVGVPVFPGSFISVGHCAIYCQ